MYIHSDALFHDAHPRVRISDHALQRFRERTELATIDEITGFVDSAIRCGRDITCYTGASRQLLLERTANGLWPITHGGLLLLLSFDRRTVVTVYPLPYWFRDESPSRHAPAHRLPERSGRLLQRIYRFCNQLVTGRPD